MSTVSSLSLSEPRQDARGHVFQYLLRLPTVAPGTKWLGEHRVLVHNHIRPTRQLGMRGFRAWLTTPDAEHLTRCDCAWAPELGDHYRIRRDSD